MKYLLPDLAVVGVPAKDQLDLFPKPAFLRDSPGGYGQVEVPLDLADPAARFDVEGGFTLVGE